MVFIKGKVPWNKGLPTIFFRCKKCGCIIGKKEHKCNEEKYNKGKTKKDYPKFANSGRKKGFTAWNKKPKKLCLDCGAKLSTQSNKYCKTHAHFGNRSRFWENGKTPLIFSIRASAKYLNWKWAVAKRDKYICQSCGTRGIKGKLKMHVDHIVPLSYLIKKFNVKSKQDSYNTPYIWDINNGRVLCKPCHKKTPTWGEGAKNFKETSNYLQKLLLGA